MQQQADHDAMAKEEHRRQDDRWRRIQHQFTLLQHEVQQDRQDRQQQTESPAAISPRFIERKAVPSLSPSNQDGPEADPVKTDMGGLNPRFRRFPGWKGPKMQLKWCKGIFTSQTLCTAGREATSQWMSHARHRSITSTESDICKRKHQVIGNTSKLLRFVGVRLSRVNIPLFDASYAALPEHPNFLINGINHVLNFQF
ncbi:hypothetical protein F2P81_013822 [Scophthalmus maximus]|uniref:Uncharacterized protein n=1 Tax=Scophthalmus maximus TaxID=52904 RepID=A0A6A4SF36_SCOMX|nr:hypothetical protein F2P81_013822 [Scophthalmus maximus]